MDFDGRKDGTLGNLFGGRDTNGVWIFWIVDLWEN